MKTLLVLALMLAGCGSVSESDQSPVATATSFVVPEGTDVNWSAICSWPETPEETYSMSGTWVTDGDNLVTGATLPFTDTSKNCAVTFTTSNDWGLANEVENCHARAPELVPKLTGAATESVQVPFTCLNGDAQVRGIGTATTSNFHACPEQTVTISDAVLSAGQVGRLTIEVSDPETLIAFSVWTQPYDSGPPAFISNPNSDPSCGEDTEGCATGVYRWSVPFTAEYRCTGVGSFWMSVMRWDYTPDLAQQGCTDREARFDIECQ